jgi:transcriptional regulator with XRE-family HTH domain
MVESMLSNKVEIEMETVMYKQIIKRLIAHKKSKQITWREVAERTGLTYSHITKLACGEKSNPTAKTMQAIEDYLNSEEPKAA